MIFTEFIAKSSMATSDIPHLTIDMLPNLPNFPENCMKTKEFGRPGGREAPPLNPPLHVASSNRYLSRGSSGNTQYTKTGNVSVARWAISLVDILFLDFVMIH